MRFERGNTSRKLRRRGGRGPYDDAQPESRGQRGCSYAGGSRASWNDDGCSADKSAWWSLISPRIGHGRCLSQRQTHTNQQPKGFSPFRQRKSHLIQAIHTCGRRCGYIRGKLSTLQVIHKPVDREIFFVTQRGGLVTTQMSFGD